MRKFDQETAIIALELQQILADFGHEIDFNSARNITDYYAPDGTFVVGETRHTGRAAIRQFYDGRAEKILTEQAEGIRTARHTFTNVRVVILDDHNAALYFFNINYSGQGAPPLSGFAGPTFFSDCRMLLRREAGGEWLITEFGGEPTFIGGDSFLNRMVGKA
jgi:hypothetical protein